MAGGILTSPGHGRNAGGGSHFRVFAPRKHAVAVLLVESGREIALSATDDGHWTADTDRLPPGTLYWLVVDGRQLPDPASRCQPQGVHGPSMVVDVEPAASPGWAGVLIGDAIVYELHVGTFTAEGTLAAARSRLRYLADLGVNVVELLPLAAFPGERNWGYDGTFHYALHPACGSHAELRGFIEAAHAAGIAVLLDVVYNHFGPEGHYADAIAPYTKRAATPWGAAVNFDGEDNHGIRAFFLDNLRYWIEEVGFDGVRMDAVSLIFDNMPVHILREFTDLARAIGRRQGREVLTIAEHLRNNRFVTADPGFGYHSQWNDDLNHALFAYLTGETGRHYANFGGFDDIAKALRDGFVLDGSRYDRVHRYFLGTDGALTEGHEHVVHIQNHDQVGNRPSGDRMIARYGRPRALLAITAVMASPFVPMLFMGEEYGETAPFLFFVDFSDPALIAGVRRGRQAEFGQEGVEFDDPQQRATFEKSKLQWQRLDSTDGRAINAYYRQLIALKRAGWLGPRRRADVVVDADPLTRIITLATPQTLTVMNFADTPQPFAAPAGARLIAASLAPPGGGELAAYGACIFERAGVGSDR